MFKPVPFFEAMQHPNVLGQFDALREPLQRVAALMQQLPVKKNGNFDHPGMHPINEDADQGLYRKSELGAKTARYLLRRTDSTQGFNPARLQVLAARIKRHLDALMIAIYAEIRVATEIDAPEAGTDDAGQQPWLPPSTWDQAQVDAAVERVRKRAKNDAKRRLGLSKKEKPRELPHVEIPKEALEIEDVLADFLGKNNPLDPRLYAKDGQYEKTLKAVEKLDADPELQKLSALLVSEIALSHLQEQFTHLNESLASAQGR